MQRLNADCAVFGVPDRDGGESILAVVQPSSSVVADQTVHSGTYRLLLTQLSPPKFRRTSLYGKSSRETTGKR